MLPVNPQFGIRQLAGTAALAALFAIIGGLSLSGDARAGSTCEDSVVILRREADSLRAEVARLTADAARAKSGDSVSYPATDTAQVIDTSSSCYLSKSNTRHNSSCMYYRKVKGRECGKNEGTACKKCGG